MAFRVACQRWPCMAMQEWTQGGKASTGSLGITNCIALLVCNHTISKFTSVLQLDTISQNLNLESKFALWRFSNNTMSGGMVLTGQHPWMQSLSNQSFGLTWSSANSWLFWTTPISKFLLWYTGSNIYTLACWQGL